LKLTNRCNLKCTMCGQVYSGIGNENEIPLEMIEKCLNNVKTIEHVYLFGGEPLLYSKFDDLLKLLGEKKIPAMITTNGMLLDRYAESIVKAGIRDLDISIDSHKNEVYRKIRKNGDLDKVLNNVKKLIEIKKIYGLSLPKIGINCVILPDNYMELVDYYRYFEERFPEIERVTFEFPMRTNVDIGEETNLVYKESLDCEFDSWKWFLDRVREFSQDEMTKIYNQISILKKYNKVHIQGPSSEEQLLSPMKKRELLKRKKCDYPFSTISLLPGGKTTFCTDFPDFAIGNLNCESLKDIWSNDHAKKFRERIITNGCFPICECCSHFHDVISQERESI